MYSFDTAKKMAKSMAFHFGTAYINLDCHCGYYVTSCSTNNTIGRMTKAGKFSVWVTQKN
jgi:hypothetical protein